MCHWLPILLNPLQLRLFLILLFLAPVTPSPLFHECQLLVLTLRRPLLFLFCCPMWLLLPLQLLRDAYADPYKPLLLCFYALLLLQCLLGH